MGENRPSPAGWVRILLTLALILPASVGAAPQPARVVISANHRFLQNADGSPFFWLGDTAWLLFARLDRAETLRYLDDRRSKGFNVVQVVLLQTADMQNAYGSPALIDGDPGKPNVAPGQDNYWAHVDWVVDQAAQRGIYVAMVPAWGALAKRGELNVGNVTAYASFLAHRYRHKPNIFWLAGGDIRGDQQTEVWQQMGRTLKAEDPNHLITFHPFGRTQSSTWFHNEPWLDFNMFQSGHQRYDQDKDSAHRYGEDNWRYVLDDYSRRPVKPVLDGEPSYENIPQGLHDTTQPYWTAADCRRYAYWSVFAGAFGHTYGDNAIMQFHKPGAGKASYGPKNFWYEALDDPGAAQMQWVKRLILSRPYFERIPDQSAIAGENGVNHDYIAVTRGKSYLFAYDYSGRRFELRMGVIAGKQVRVSWYSPRDGSTKPAGTFPNAGVRAFTPPDRSDWVLVLDSR